MEGEEEGAEGSAKNDKLMRCQCCKQLGHKIQNCQLDPNLKTTGDISEDEIRLLTTTANRKMHIDSVVSTVQLFKKAVMIELAPKEETQTQPQENSQEEQSPSPAKPKEKTGGKRADMTRSQS